MTEEDDNLAHGLARDYASARGEISWNDPGYTAWAERRYAENHIVYLVWRDDTKPHHIDYDLLKDERPTGGDLYTRYPLRVQESAKFLRATLRVSDPVIPDECRPLFPVASKC